MEVVQIKASPLSSHPHFMNQVSSSSSRASLRLLSFRFRCFCTLPSSNLTQNEPKINGSDIKKSVSKASRRAKAKVSDAQLKKNWLNSFSLSDFSPKQGGSDWVIGVDPDAHGALALLKTDDSGCSAQVFDSPHLEVPIGKGNRRRLDTKSIVQLLQSFGAPIGTCLLYPSVWIISSGTIAYVEQSTPCPQDGKQGWYNGGYCYGLWIGALVASGFSVVPVPSRLWKNAFKLSGGLSNKDDSRALASTFFPSTSSLLSRKKDHGRAEALLIAAYGKGLNVLPDSSCILEDSVA